MMVDCHTSLLLAAMMAAMSKRGEQRVFAFFAFICHPLCSHHIKQPHQMVTTIGIIHLLL
jgi:hypothetical protein